MWIVSLIVSAVVMAVVGALTWRHQKSLGEDYEPDWMAVVKNVVLTGGVLIILGRIQAAVVAMLVDYWWYQDVGQPEVWVTRTSAEWLMWLTGFVTTWLVLSLSQFAAHYLVPGVPKAGSDSRQRAQQDGEWKVVWNYYSWIARLVKFLLAVGFGWAARYVLTTPVLRASGAVNWGVVDPVRGADYVFYDAYLPVLNLVLGFVFWLGLVTAVVTLLVYAVLYLRHSVYYGDLDSKTKFYDGVWCHGLLFVALLFVVWGATSLLAPARLLLDGTSDVITGAGYVDVTARMGGYSVMAVVWFLAALATTVYAFLPKRWYVAVAMYGVPVVVHLIVLGAIPFFKGVEYNTDPLRYEGQYIEYQIRATRFAFDLEEINDQGELPYRYQLTMEELAANDATLSQTRIVDWDRMRVANESLNEFLQYYSFHDTDVDRYGGREVMVSVREVDPSQLPGGVDPWTSRHFRYTHGYGYTVASVSDLTPLGEPVFLVRNMPPNELPEYSVTRPEIYFGEVTTDWVFTGGKLTEFGRPEGTGVEEVVYEGPAGVEVGSLFRRYVFAVYHDDYRLLFSALIDRDTRALYHRTLDQRLAKLGWFLQCDGDPYPVLGGEEVVYVRDCYTTSNSLPYSQDFGGVNYMRGSVKMTVGAYTGETNFYVLDSDDPVIQAWVWVFPGLFHSVDEMPDYLLPHLRYPDDLVSAQADAYAAYHVTDPVAFYGHQDLWARALETRQVSGNPAVADPRYVMMAVPGGGGGVEFVSSLFFTPNGKQNAAAGMVVRNDPGHYGEISVFRFPRDETVVGLQTAEARINSDPYISGQVTVWNQQGSEVIWGQTIGLVLAGGGGEVSPAYVRSIYLQATGAKVPAIKLVIVSHGDSLVYGSTLAEVLGKLYGTPVVTPPAQVVENQPLPGEVAPPVVAGDQNLVLQAQAHFDTAQACASVGDWECFGREMEALEVTLDAMQP